MNAIVTSGAGASALMPTNMESAFKLAEMMSRGKLVPTHLQGQPGDCLMVIEQAMRWGMSPFAVAQSTSVIQGKLMFEGKLVSAAVHGSGMLAGRLSYEFSGEGDTRAVKVLGTIKGEAAPRDMEVRLKDAKTNNGMWTKQPDQQLIYFGTRAWARRHTPEVMLGVYSPEEMDTPQPREDFTGTTLDSSPVEDAPPPKTRKVSDILDEIKELFAKAEDRDAVDVAIASDVVQKAMDIVRGGAKDSLQKMVNEAIARTATLPDETE